MIELSKRTIEVEVVGNTVTLKVDGECFLQAHDCDGIRLDDFRSRSEISLQTQVLSADEARRLIEIFGNGGGKPALPTEELPTEELTFRPWLPRGGELLNDTLLTE